MGVVHDARLPGAADRVHAGLDGLANTDLAALTDGDILEALEDVYRAESRLVAQKARLVGEADARHAHAAERAQSLSQWIAHRCGVPAGAARNDLMLARSLRHLPDTAGKLADGDIGRHQATVIARHHQNPRTTEALERDEAMLAGEAARLPWPLFKRVAAYWGQLADPEGTDDDAEERRCRRRVKLRQGWGNDWAVDGLLDPIGGTVVDTALRRIEDELFAEDRAEAIARLGRTPHPFELRRTVDQRRADALVEMARRAMATPPGSRRPAPLVTILVGYETFAGRVCELADGAVVAPSDVAALLDDAVIERAVFEGPSRVMDIGEQRLFTGALRRAIELRDRTCTHPYCDAPVWRCDVDHKIPYAAGGPTTQDNGRLYCPFHNHDRQKPWHPPPDG